MNRKFIIFGIIVLLTSIVLSGCFDNKTNNDSSEDGDGPKANLLMTEWYYKTDWDSLKGDYITINLTIYNNGSANATGVRVHLRSTNQDNLLEANKTAILPALSPNEFRDTYFSFDYEKETFLLYNKITIRWNGDSREYLEVIDLED